MDFKQGLIITIVDKGLLALIVIIAAYLLNRLIEKYKSKLSRDNSIVKERLLSLNDIWKAIYYWIAESNLDYGPKLSFKKENDTERRDRYDTILKNEVNPENGDLVYFQAVTKS